MKLSKASKAIEVSTPPRVVVSLENGVWLCSDQNVVGHQNWVKTSPISTVFVVSLVWLLDGLPTTHAAYAPEETS
eukprot:3060153-Amphidinium_carterae.2